LQKNHDLKKFKSDLKHLISFFLRVFLRVCL
jgi:hypothetical protein